MRLLSSAPVILAAAGCLLDAERVLSAYIGTKTPVISTPDPGSIAVSTTATQNLLIKSNSMTAGADMLDFDYEYILTVNQSLEPPLAPPVEPFPTVLPGAADYTAKARRYSSLSYCHLLTFVRRRPYRQCGTYRASNLVNPLVLSKKKAVLERTSCLMRSLLAVQRIATGEKNGGGVDDPKEPTTGGEFDFTPVLDFLKTEEKNTVISFIVSALCKHTFTLISQEPYFAARFGTLMEKFAEHLMPLYSKLVGEYQVSRIKFLDLKAEHYKENKKSSNIKKNLHQWLQKIQTEPFVIGCLEIVEEEVPKIEEILDIESDRANVPVLMGTPFTIMKPRQPVVQKLDAPFDMSSLLPKDFKKAEEEQKLKFEEEEVPKNTEPVELPSEVAGPPRQLLFENLQSFELKMKLDMEVARLHVLLRRVVGEPKFVNIYKYCPAWNTFRKIMSRLRKFTWSKLTARFARRFQTIIRGVDKFIKRVGLFKPAGYTQFEIEYFEHLDKVREEADYVYGLFRDHDDGLFDSYFDWADDLEEDDYEAVQKARDERAAIAK